MSEGRLQFIWWRDGAILAATIAVLATAYMIWRELRAANRMQSASYVLELDERISSGRLKAFRDSIEQNGSGYALRGHGFGQSDIDDYLSVFETVGEFVREGVIPEDLAYEEFSYDAEKTYCNKAILAEIVSDRLTDVAHSGPQAFYVNFSWMARRFLARDHKRCEDMDAE